jgi:hypothetical protein
MVGKCRQGRTIGLANVQVLPAINQTVQSATIRGNVLSDGGESTEVFLNNPKTAMVYSHTGLSMREKEPKHQNLRACSEEAQLKGGVTWIASAKEELGSALSFWGEEQSYLDLGSFNLGGGAMSLTGWFKLRNLGDGIRVLDFADDEYGTNAIFLKTHRE